MLPNSRALVDNLSTPLRQPQYPKLPLPYIPFYRHWRIIPVLSQPVFSLWCPVLAMIREKYCLFSTSLVVQVCGPACLLDVTLETI